LTLLLTEQAVTKKNMAGVVASYGSDDGLFDLVIYN